MKKIAVLLLSLLFISCNTTFAQRVWINNLRTMFLNNSAIILEINLRSFNAQDTDKDGLIKKSEKEESGTFLNAISRLDSVQATATNTILLMPINKLGKIKALGTAGSLYAVSDFTKLNPQLINDKTILSDIEQAKKFIREAHNRNLHVIVELPACAAYDLYLERPELFLKDSNGEAVIPNNWSDVRLLNAGNENAYNKEVFAMYQGFVDLMLEMEVDGIRASEPSTKPASFWKDLINYSRQFDSQMLWLAQNSNNGRPIMNSPINTPIENLLNVGFDGYYGFTNEFKNYTSAKEVTEQLSKVFNKQEKNTNPKAILGAFATHDDLSPVLSKGLPYSVMLLWLNATLPVNSFTLDGNQGGDNFVYAWGNKRATNSDTDDKQYFVNRGKIDIYNYSRRPILENPILMNEYVMANQFKRYYATHLNSGDFHILKTTNPNVFAYAISYNSNTILVMGNISSNAFAKSEVKLTRKFDPDKITIPVKITQAPMLNKGKININLSPNEIQILIINNYEL